MKVILQTFLTRFLILGLNFGLLILTTNLWGMEGKGMISLLIADLAIVTFLNNILSGSSVSYYASKFDEIQIVSAAYLWSLVIGFVAPLLISLAHPVEYLGYLVALSVMFSLLSANINLFVGRNDIKNYNIYLSGQQAVHIILILFVVYGLRMKSVDVYFMTLFLCYAVLFILSFLRLIKTFGDRSALFSWRLFQKMFNYGWKIQISAFLQFLNNRLSFYFLEFFRGIASVGIFAVGVAVSEAVLAISRSLSVILYSDLVSSTAHDHAIEKTKISLKISFLISSVFLLFLVAVPGFVYEFIFGKDFSQTRIIVLLLSPGILAMAVSNIIGHYFAGINKLGILNMKSVVGFVCTVALSLYAVPKWGIYGACTVTSLSYLFSSGLLFYYFYQRTPFSVRDFLLTKTEVRKLYSKLRQAK
ncbi:teichoic acid transporter [Chryseobacterium sp. 6424]|uniref:lipopolysaccharide biosynthesis protein n=1 Tax=Chryseobacterium sp. 6424 TaxID=2039166 RepID=UPI000EFAA100|nr:polysaccharide biosynthesis C-terminal domain-containing protein [Chryseobacterium sp. 6424]AYO56772.1 teichoic acid transporter [Chryseobacterium sp. 6424]